MLRAIVILGLAIAAGAATEAFAQSDEIIVTGARRSSYDSDFIPVVHMKRKADFMVMRTSVESDSRDAKLRESEVLSTLEAMASRADRNAKIELGILRVFETDDDDIEYVEPYSTSAIKAAFSRGSRTDTTAATIVVKTPIDAGADSVDSAVKRIEGFIAGVPVTGRATVEGDGEPGLSIVGIEQYRAALLRQLAADNESVRKIFGDGYAVEISGLEKPLQWRVIGPLDLAIYFPYQSSASPQP